MQTLHFKPSVINPTAYDCDVHWTVTVGPGKVTETIPLTLVVVLNRGLKLPKLRRTATIFVRP